jgi:hypothetical protein
MNLSLLKNFLAGSLPAPDFCSILKSESNTFRMFRDLAGSSTPVYTTNDIPELSISTADIECLCNLYFNDHITDAEFEYLRNFLEFNDAITYDERIGNFLSKAGSPDINEGLTKPFIQELLKNI